MTEPPAGPPPERYDRYDDGRDRDGGHGWQLVAVALLALIVGAGAAYLIKDDSSTKTEVRTVQQESRTVTVPLTPSATEAVTVTQPPPETVVKTTVETVTVTVPTVTTATEP